MAFIWESIMKRDYMFSCWKAGVAAMAALSWVSCGPSPDFLEVKKAAEDGDAGAQFQVGKMYINGDGTGKDFDKGNEWLKKSAGQDHEKAAHRLGMVYRYGHGVDVDYSESAKWFRQSAELGYMAGQSELGQMYRMGWGLETNAFEAYKWIRMAADRGNKTAISRKSELETNLTPEQIKTAEKWISEFKPRAPGE